MCRTHGGSLPQTLAKARDRLIALAVRRAADASWQRWQRALADFQANRIMITSELMGVPAREVTPALMAWCHDIHGAPPPYWEAPTRPGPHHMTRRYLDGPH